MASFIFSIVTMLTLLCFFEDDNMVSMLEYGAVMMDLTHDIIRFKLNKGRLTRMFKMMDKNMDDMLSSDEMGSLLVAMDGKENY